MPPTQTKASRRKPRSAEWRSGARALGISEDQVKNLVRENRKGFGFRCLANFEKSSGFPREKIARLVGIPLRTLTRRQNTGKLQPQESDRLLRASRIFGLAVELFEGDRDAARIWLTTSKAVFGGETPVEMATTEAGARAVEELIGRLEHGVFS